MSDVYYEEDWWKEIGGVLYRFEKEDYLKKIEELLRVNKELSDGSSNRKEYRE